jgi:hypothetical protein
LIEKEFHAHPSSDILDDPTLESFKLVSWEP